MGQTLATISVYSLQKYYKEVQDKDLFDGVVFPDNINRETVINNILLESMPFEVYYTDPNFLHDAITMWGKKYEWTFNKWAEALKLEYDPISNYDRHEEWTDNGSKDNTKKETANSTVDTKTDSNGKTDNYYDNTTDHYVWSYDSGNKHQDEQTIDESGTRIIDEQHSTGNTTGNQTNNGTEKETIKNTRSGRAWGNIGVTTSQQMLQSEFEIAAWNIVQHITDTFLHEFCIMVY